MTTIEVDPQVYAWLQGHARPFHDTPNSVLRRVTGMDAIPVSAAASEKPSAKLLNKKWAVGARHALYHREGSWFQRLERFPGALFDPRGYVVFETEEAYRGADRVTVGYQTNVADGISNLQGYVRMV